MTEAVVFDNRPCQLGEGSLWHPKLRSLFWFDILGCQLMRDDGAQWQFDENVSAAGWISDHKLLIASETQLLEFDIETGSQKHIAPLEQDDPSTRSNDGRADPFGGFWIGTMGKNAEPDRGAIYRYYKGALRKLFSDITISNSICFAPDRSCAYYTDTARNKLMRVTLDTEGWPNGSPDIFIDCATEDFGIDGSITTADGSILNAQWGASRVCLYNKTGDLTEIFKMPAIQASCPALGGPDLTTLYVTSARQGMSPDELKADPHAGKTFMCQTGITGREEPSVIL